MKEEVVLFSQAYAKGPKDFYTLYTNGPSSTPMCARVCIPMCVHGVVCMEKFNEY